MRHFFSGRSMLEMLGVLAIVGVLSIGGLMGYRVAMTRYQANEISNFINRTKMAIKDICIDGTSNCSLFQESTIANINQVCPMVGTDCEPVPNQTRYAYLPMIDGTFLIAKTSTGFEFFITNLNPSLCIQLAKNGEYNLIRYYVQRQSGDWDVVSKNANTPYFSTTQIESVTSFCNATLYNQKVTLYFQIQN